MKENNTDKSFTLLYDSAATVLTCSKEESRKQMIGDFSPEEIEEVFPDGVIFEDQYEMRKYSLYEDENKNLLLISCACLLDQYVTDEDLPEPEELFRRFTTKEEYRHLINTLNAKQKQIIYLSQRSDTTPEYILIDDESLYNKVFGKNYLISVGMIEDRIELAS